MTSQCTTGYTVLQLGDPVNTNVGSNTCISYETNGAAARVTALAARYPGDASLKSSLEWMGLYLAARKTDYGTLTTAVATQSTETDASSTNLKAVLTELV